MNIEERFPVTSETDSIIEKDWAVGSNEFITSDDFVYELTVVAKSKKTKAPTQTQICGIRTQLKYPPSLEKIIDEVVVNALDHIPRTCDDSTRVSYIKISLDMTSGQIKVSNDGRGIPIIYHKVAKMMLPQFIFGVLHQGENRFKAADCIIGGTNGMGAKLTNTYSSEFIVETVDDSNFYIQRWTDHRKQVEPPIVLDLKSSAAAIPINKRQQHTTICFTPDYSIYNIAPNAAADFLQHIIFARAVYAAVYCDLVVTNYNETAKVPHPPVTVYYNDTPLNISLSTLAKSIAKDGEVIETRVGGKFKWSVAVIIEQNIGGELSIVNGILVRKGTHTKYLLDQLKAGIKEQVSKEMKDETMQISSNIINENMFLLVAAQIPCPSWDGQRKDALSTDRAKFASYKLDPVFIKKVAKAAAVYIKDKLLSKKSKTKKDKIDYSKYTDAGDAGGKLASACSLIAVEGDSAETQVRVGLSKNPGLGFKKYGLISLGGVIVNARKEIHELITRGGIKHIRQSPKLRNNVLFKALVGVLGLNIDYTYDPAGPNYNKEKKSLRYGHLIACVDQDDDGVGNILGLLLNIFEVFWPKLIAAGFVQMFKTPLIRAYPKNKGVVEEFYTVQAWKKFEAAADASKYDVKYYKGLATHGDLETKHMFSKFHERLYTFSLDKNSHEMFEVYFGKDPDLRKIALKVGGREPDDNLINIQEKSRSITCSDHLLFSTHAYDLDNLDRKLLSAIDGMNQSGRKIYNSALSAFGAKNKEMRVSQLAGYVSRHGNYHHGESSLTDAIANKAFIAVGGRQLPQFVPLSSFGGRGGGGAGKNGDAGQPRYINCQLNIRCMKYLYPAADYELLSFNIIEGKRCEPRYFIPIIPTAVLETTEQPSHGWKIKLWARDVFDVLNVVKTMIICDDNMVLPMRADVHGFSGRLGTIRGKLASFGKYKITSNDTIIITELPLRVWTYPYVDKLKEKADKDGLILDVHDEGNSEIVHIVVKVQDAAAFDKYADDPYTDGIETYFELYNHMDSHINMIADNGGVLEFKTYEEVVRYWFMFRKNLYIERADRDHLLLKYEIILQEQIVKYLTEYNDLFNDSCRLRDMTDEQIDAKLAAAGFIKIKRERITNPGFIKTAEIYEAVFGSAASYEYLVDKITDRMKNAASVAKAIEKLTTLREKLIVYEKMLAAGRFRGSQLWLEELAELKKNIEAGISTSWLYEAREGFIYK